MLVNQKGGKSCDRAEGVAVWETDDMMSECEKKKKKPVVLAAFWRAAGGGAGTVAVRKCRVSINGGRGEEAQVSVVGQWCFAGGDGGGGRARGGGEHRGSEREQSASWGRDIGESNKQTTDTYKYMLFLNTRAQQGGV